MENAKKTVNVLLYGIGGQGVLTASEVCALAAMADGYHVKKSEVKGMAQRGGVGRVVCPFRGEGVFAAAVGGRLRRACLPACDGTPAA